MTRAQALSAFALLAVIATAAWYLGGDAPPEPATSGGAAAAAAATVDDRPVAPPTLTTPDRGAAETAPTEGGPAGVERTVADVDAPAAAPTKGAARASVTLRGRVVDEAGVALPGVPVTCAPRFLDFLDGGSRPTPADARTDTNGAFRFPDLQGGVGWTITARPPQLTTARVEVPGTSTGDLDLGDLTVQVGGSISGVVRDEGGQPLSGVEVSAWGQRKAQGDMPFLVLGDFGGEPDRKTTTDASGAFRVDGLAAGAALVLAAKNGYARESVRDIPITRGEVARDVELALARGAAISGVVVDGRGAPVRDARVEVMETIIDLTEPGASASFGAARTATTDAAGHCQIDGLKDGNYNVVARADGLLPSSARGVAAGADDVRVTLQPSGVVYGYVTDARTGAAVEDFRVEVGRAGMLTLDDVGFDVRGRQARVVYGDEAARLAGVAETAGLFAALDLPSSSVDLRVDAEGYNPWRHGPVRVGTGETARADAKLAAELRLTGVVLDADGAPVAGAEVAVQRAMPEGEGGAFMARRVRIGIGDDGPSTEEGAEFKRAVSGDDGRFVVRGLATGAFDVTANHPEWAPAERLRVEVEDEDPRPITLTLNRGGALEGVTFDADGNLLPRGRVTLTKKRSGGRGLRMFGPGGGGMIGPGGLGAPLHAMADGQGRYEIRGIPPGDYLAKIEKPASTRGNMMIAIDGMGGDADEGTPITIEEGQTAQLDLHLEPTGTVTGRIIASGAPVEGASLRLAKDGAGPMMLMPAATAVTAKDGRFEMADLVPGDYTLKVTVKGGAQPIEREVKVRPRDVTREEISLPTGSIRGRVVDADSGDPLSGVIVDVQRPRRDDEPEQRQAFAFALRMVADDGGDGGGMTTMRFGDEEEVLVTDDDGWYHAQFLEAGPYDVSIRGGGVIKEKRDSVHVQEGGLTDNIDFNARRGARIHLTVFPREGEELTFFQAELSSAEHPDENEQRMEAGTNKSTFDGLAPGQYTIKVTSNGHEGRETVVLESGEDRPVTIRLE